MSNYEILNQKMGSDDIALKDYKAEAYSPQPNPNINSIYTESPSVTQAKLNLQNQLNNGYSAYQNNNSDKILSLIEGLNSNNAVNVNTQPFRKEFEGNLNRSANETLMNLAKLSGGYGNTYGSAVADQQKQAGMQSINDINPALVSLAQSIKQSDKNNVYNILDAYKTQDDMLYGRHRDTVADNQAETQRLTDMLLSAIKNDRSNFEADRNFNQGAYEFTEAQKQSAFEDYQDRLQSQVQEDNSNKLDAWGRTWDNYWKAQDINEANKQNAFDEKYNDYQLSERAKAKAEAEAKARAKAQEEDESEGSYTYESGATSPGIEAFKNAHFLTKEEFNKRVNANPTVGYMGYTSYDDYIDAELDSFNYTVEEDGKKIKLTDNEKKHLIMYYDTHNPEPSKNENKKKRLQDFMINPRDLF